MTQPARSSKIKYKELLAGLFWSPLLLFCLSPAFTQVGPAEIKDPRLRATEQNYFSHLAALNQAISTLKFPFKLSLNRYVGLDPKDQIGADTRGLEYVIFHERELLKISANYNAAFNADLLTPNQRAGRVLGEVIVPVLRLLPEHFSQGVSFDGFGFEIGYHVRKHNRSYEYEGKENLVVVFDKADGLRYPLLQDDASRQEILNRSEIYLNGEPFGLALNSKAPMEVEALVRRPSASAEKTSAPLDAGAQPKAPRPDKPLTVPTTEIQPKTAGVVSPAVPADLDTLRKKYQLPLEKLAKDGVAEYHFVDYAPPSFVIIHDQIALQATLRNPEPFDKNTTSIYRRAARSFDLFLAPQLKSVLSKIPESPDFSAVDFSVVNELTSSTEKSSEAIEFILPLKEARQFANSQITNQDLIDKSIVLVNGVRIALNLAQVE
jgi:hypothetical protein